MNIKKIEKISQPTLSDVVEIKIREFIIDSNLRPGDRLPGELEFSEQLGVSRNIVREALSRLRMLGIAESKKRRGMILTEPNVFKGLEAVFDLPVLSEQKRKELFQLRVFLEIGMAGGVYRNKTDKAIQQLEKIIERESESESDVAFRVALDVDFHTVLYGLVGNDTLKSFQAVLKPFITENTTNFMEDRAAKKGTTHRELLQMLKEGTEDEFIAAMRKHLGHYVD